MRAARSARSTLLRFLDVSCFTRSRHRLLFRRFLYFIPPCFPSFSFCFFLPFQPAVRSQDELSCREGSETVSHVFKSCSCYRTGPVVRRVVLGSLVFGVSIFISDGFAIIIISFGDRPSTNGKMSRRIFRAVNYIALRKRSTAAKELTERALYFFCVSYLFLCSRLN